MSQVINKPNPSPEARASIYKAIEDVYAKTGRKPKYAEVMDLYNTSNSYIKVVMEQWLEDKSDDLKAAEQVEEPKTVELEPSAIQAIKDVLTEETLKAQARAEAKLDEERKKLYELKDEVAEELQAQMDQYDNLFMKEQGLRDDFESQAKKTVKLEAELKSERDGHHDALASIKRLEDDVTRLTKRNNTLEDDLSTAKQSISTVSADLKTKVMQLEELKSQNDRLKSEIQVAADRTTKQLDQKDTELMAKNDTITKLEQRVEQLSADSYNDKSKLATLEGQNKALEQQLADMQGKLVKADNNAQKLNDSLLSLKSELKLANDHIASIEKTEKPKHGGK